MKSGVFITKDKTKQILAGIAALPKKDVLVGIPQDKGPRKNDEADNDITNAQLGYIHNFGAPEANIPQREFLAPGIKDVQAKINEYFAQAGKAALAGNFATMDRALHAAGLAAKLGVQNKINNGPFLPLAPSTLAARLRRGRTGTVPLIDTAQLRNSITYVIREKA
jgi:hypothetical protein